jgi:hypothetical protein
MPPADRTGGSCSDGLVAGSGVHSNVAARTHSKQARSHTPDNRNCTPDNRNRTPDNRNCSHTLDSHSRRPATPTRRRLRLRRCRRRSTNPN